MLSSRFVGPARVDIMGGRTLKEHCSNTPPVPNYALNYSRKALVDLGFIEEVDGVYVPNELNQVRTPVVYLRVQAVKHVRLLSYWSLKILWKLHFLSFNP